MTAAQPRAWLLRAWLGVAGIIGMLAAVHTFPDEDLWWHLALGRHLVAYGMPQSEPFAFATPIQSWVDEQWLYEIILNWLRGVSPVLAALVPAVAATCAYLIAARALPRTLAVPGPCLAMAVILSIFASGQVLGTRGQVITVFGMAVVLWILARWRDGDNRQLWLLPPLMVMWTNMHAGFIVGVIVPFIAVALPRTPRWGISGARRPLLMAALAGTAATLVNPAGVHLYGYVVSTFANGSITQVISDWQSPDFHNFWIRLLEVDAIALVGAWILAPGGPDFIDILFAGGAFATTLMAQRNMAIFAVVATPQLARYGWAAWQTHRHRIIGDWHLPKLSGAATPIASALMLLLAAGAVGMALQRPMRDVANGRQEAHYEPAAAVTYVIAKYPRQRIYSTYELGGYLVYRMPDNRVVYIYGESAIFGSAQLQAYLDIHLLRTNWVTRLADLNVRHAILPARTQEVAAFYEIGWRVECHDVNSDNVVMSLTVPAAPALQPQPDPNTAPSC